MGEEVKLAKRLPFKLFVFDDKIITIALQNKMSSGLKFVTLLIEHQDFATSLIEIFELYWVTSMTINEYKSKKEKGELK